VVELVLAALTGFALVTGTAMMFYRFQWRILLFLAPLLVVLAVIMYVQGDSFSYVLAPVIAGVVAGFTFRNGRNYQFFVVWVSVVLTVLFTLNFYVLKTMKGVDLMQQSRVQFETMLENAELGAREKEEILGRVEQSMPIIRDLVPFSYFLNVLIFAMITFVLLRYIFERLGYIKVMEVAGVERFKLNDYSVFGLIVGWLVVLLVDAGQFPYLHQAALNLGLIMAVFYVIQGTGIVKFFLISRGWPLFLLPLIFLVSLMLGPAVILFVLMMFLGLGAIDFWVDFRKFSSVPTGDGKS